MRPGPHSIQGAVCSDGAQRLVHCAQSYNKPKQLGWKGTDFFPRNYSSKSQGNSGIFNVLNENNCQSRVLCLIDIPHTVYRREKDVFREAKVEHSMSTMNTSIRVRVEGVVT